MFRYAFLAPVAVFAVACADPFGAGGPLAQGLHVADGGAHDDDACADGKCFVCHVPPGSPDNAHTIHVGESAVDAHLRHGDALGACGDAPDVDDVDADSDSEADSDSDTDGDSDGDTDGETVIDAGAALDDGDGDADPAADVDAGVVDSGCPDAGFIDAE